METVNSRLWLLSGQRGVGKTAFCVALARLAQLEGWQVGGLLTPAIFTGGAKTGILAENLKTGETRPLASLVQSASFDLPLGKWYFDRSVIAWGNRVLRDSLPCDLLIIDEYGPLELLRHEGWWASVDVLSRKEFRAALVVVRPELEGFARQALNISRTIILGYDQAIEPSVRSFWAKISGND